MLIHQSNFLKYANREVDWLPMDTEELYKENLVQNYDKLKENNWIDNPFTYKFNSDGFRCVEFKDNVPSIMFFGCSFTQGVGLPEDTIFPSIVSKSLELECYNLGQGGASSDTAFRLGQYWIPKLKPKIVVFLAPEMTRMEYLRYSPSQINKIEAKTLAIHSYKKENNKWYEEYILVEENGIINRLKNKLALENVCQQSNVKFLYITAEDFYGKHKLLKDFARDLKHPGIQRHRLFAKNLLMMV